jgi:membrane protease YdiL (CAAX protease family)
MQESSPPGNVPPVLGQPAEFSGNLNPPNRLRWLVHLLLIASFPIAVGVLGVGHGGTNDRAPALSHTATGLLVTCLVQIVVFGLFFLLAWVASKASFQDLLMRWPGFRALPLGIAYSVGLRVGIGMLGLLVAGILVAGGVFTTQDLEKFTQANAPNVAAVVDVEALRHDPVYLVLCLTLASFVMGGLREELWRVAFLAGCRHLWPNRFTSISGQMLAVIFAAVLFGMGHIVQGPVAASMAGLLGVGLGAIMVFHRSIWPAVIAHGFFDATSLALIPWAMYKLQDLRHMIAH